MRVVASVVVPAPPDEVWAWWTDFGAPGETVRVSHGLGATRREILARERNRIVLRERFGAAHFDHDVVVHADARRLDEHYLGGAWRPFRAVWRFGPEAGGRATRVSRDLDVDVPGPAVLQDLEAPAARRLVEMDLRAHAREFERDRAALHRV